MSSSIEENLQRAAQTVAAQLHVNGTVYSADVATLKVWIQLYLEKTGATKEEEQDSTRWALDHCS